MVTTNDAFLIVTHGSRDPRPAAAVAQLAQRLSGQHTARHAAPLVETAALEFAEQPLHQQIIQWGDRLQGAGAQRLWVLPLFLMAGVHVREDIPQEVELAQPHLALPLQLMPHLGQASQVLPLLEASFRAAEGAGAARLLLSHGSRRPGGNQGIEALAAPLGAQVAYWSIAPNLSAVVDAFVQAGQQRITILPYFLFPGGLTDAIAQQHRDLQQRHPNASLQLGPLLSQNPNFDALVAGQLQAATAPLRYTATRS